MRQLTLNRISDELRPSRATLIASPDRYGRRGGSAMARGGKRKGIGLIALVAAVAAASLAAVSADAKQQGALAALPRAETFYMSGNQWSPNTDLNPAKNWDYVTGLVGFVYETP